LIKIKRHAFLRGINISGTAVGNNFTFPAGPDRDQEIAHVKKWIDHAAVMGAPHIRIFAGAAASGTSRGEAVPLCVSAIEECCEYAGSKGILLGLENHGGIVATADEILEIVRAVKSPWLGINLDTGNFHTDDPYADLVKIAPYAVNRTGRSGATGQNPARRQLPGLRRAGIRIEGRSVDGRAEIVEADEGIVQGLNKDTSVDRKWRMRRSN